MEAMELDKLIERRALRANAEQQRVEDLFEETTRRHNEKRRAEHRDLWLDYHQGQAARLRYTIGLLIARHEAAAARLLEEAGGR